MTRIAVSISFLAIAVLFHGVEQRAEGQAVQNGSMIGVIFTVAIIATCIAWQFIKVPPQ